MFVPIMCVPWPQRPIEKGQPFPMEYVNWHKDLLKYFSNKKDYQFIWKGVLLANQRFDLAQRIIDDMAYENIEYHRNKLTDRFGKVKKIIFDTPSTAFFESIFSEIPSLALYRPNDQILRENAYTEFGKSLKPYSNIDEGLLLVDEFINDNASQKIYIPKLIQSENSAADIILNNK